MPIFEKLLEKYKLERHDGRPLWKYRISETEYKELKTEVCESFSTRDKFPYKESALLIAAWWSLEYKEETPSKEKILESIGLNASIPEIKNKFDNAFKCGMRLLNIEPIRINNKHHFRTLLVQGGLPIKRLAQAQGIYAYYVSKIYEVYNKYGKEQARYYTEEYQDLLPQTFQHKSIEELTLEICEALERDDIEFLPFDSKEEKGKELWEKIKRAKDKISSTNEKFCISLKWILQEKNLVLNARIPKHISSKWWNDNFEYDVPRIFELFICGRNIAIYKKKGDGDLSRTEYKNIIKIQPNENISYRGFSDNKQIKLQEFINLPPSLEEPFILHEAVEDGLAKLFVPHNWSLDSEYKKIDELNCGNIYEFTGEITIRNDNDSVVFDSHKSLNEDCFLVTPCLENIIYSNVPITKGPAKFFTQGKIQQQEDAKVGLIRWKFTNYSTEIFQVNEEAKLEIQAKSPSSGSIIFKNFGSALIECDVPHEKHNNEFYFESNYIDRPYIPFKISYPSVVKKKKVQIKVLAPFKGVYFKNPVEERIKNNERLCAVKLEGYSLVCTSGKAKIKIAHKEFDIEEGEHPLNEYKKKIEEALFLSDKYDYEIDLEVLQERETVAKIYFRKFNLDRNDSEIKNLKMMAFQLTSKIKDEIECKIWQDLQEDDIGKWIVYNNEQSAMASVKPFLQVIGEEDSVNSDLLEKAIYLKVESERIKAIQDVLKKDTDILCSDYWRTIANYAIFCKEHRIPLDTLDYFKAILRDQQLATRFFFVLTLHFDRFNDIYNIIKDQNFDWCFISKETWAEEIEIIIQAKYHNPILKKILENIKNINDKYKTNSTHIHKKDIRIIFGKLRQKLSENQQRKLKIPTKFEEQYNSKAFSMENILDKHKDIFYAPLLVALLATGEYKIGWNNQPENYFRYLRCCCEIDSMWFDSAYDFFYQDLLKTQN